MPSIYKGKKYSYPDAPKVWTPKAERFDPYTRKAQQKAAAHRKIVDRAAREHAAIAKHNARLASGYGFDNPVSCPFLWTTAKA
jgi:hypothetical protein